MNTQKQIFTLSVFFLLLLPTTTSAATISLRAAPTDIGAGDEVLVTVLLDSSIATNAFSGTLSYPSAVLEPIAISDGNSIINLWITHPVVSTAGEDILFAGITPGGFSGTGGILFSILFRATTAGVANISLGNIEVLRNDGRGGKEPVTMKPLALSIKSKSSGGYTEPDDYTPPEAFVAYRVSDPQLFNGQNYLVFMTADKGSGVDHYEVAESRVPSFLFSFFPRSWNTTISPYVIADQDLTSTVYIKAVDRAGNERLSISPPQRLFTVYEKVVFLGILIVVVFLWQKVWRRRFGKNL